MRIVADDLWVDGRVLADGGNGGRYSGGGSGGAVQVETRVLRGMGSITASGGVGGPQAGGGAGGRIAVLAETVLDDFSSRLAASGGEGRALSGQRQ